MPQSKKLQKAINSALEDYFDWEYEAWVEILADLEQDKKEFFLPLDAVRTYFTTCDSQLQRNLDKILIEIFDVESSPVDSDLILRGHTAIFCILLQIDRGRYIKHFTCFEELSDQHLPFDLTHPPRPFPIFKSDSTFLEEFCKIQLRYCVPVFNPHMLHKNFGRQRLLPITFKEQLRTQGQATAHIITLYGPHNKITQESVKTPKSNTFVLKSYPNPQADILYTRQVSEFRSIKNSDDVLKFYGSFEYRDQSHILLEFADKGTLYDFFRTEAPPTRGEQIIDFWDNILQLTRGLKAIQSVKENHNDICSQKILVLSNGARLPSSWKFKFSDLGPVSEYVNSSPKFLHAKSADNFHSTPFPNNLVCQQNKSGCQYTKSLANSDIWQLGCVFSQAAFWIADGYKGIIDFYRKLGDSKDIRKKMRPYEVRRISENVIDAHAEIENNLRRSDYITKEVLVSIVDEMLWDEDRPNIEVLIEKAENIITAARQTLAEMSLKKPSRRRSQSRNTSRASSPAPPVPLVLKSVPKISSPISRLPQRVGSLQTNFINNSTPLPNSSSVISVTKDETSDIQSTNLYIFNSLSKVTSEEESDNLATSWFLDSPIIDSSSIPPTLKPMRIRQCQSQSFESDQTSNLGLPFEINLPFEPYGTVNSSHVIDTNKVLNVKKTVAVNEETGRNVTYEVCLPSLKTSPLQKPSSESCLPPPIPRNSHFQNMQSENIASLYPPYESSSISYGLSPSSHGLRAYPEQYDLQPPHTGTSVKRLGSIHRLKLENDIYHRVWSLSDHSVSCIGLETPATSNDRSCNESLSSSTCSSLTNKSVGSGSRPSFRPKTRRIPSFNSRRRNSSSSRLEGGSTLSRTATKIFTARQSVPEFPYLTKVAHVDMNTCRYWKHLNKTSRKKSMVPLLPGAYLLDPLKKFDHVFIVDDSVSMAPHWTNVCLVFESLSYVVKGMSPLGTQLFFTISSDSLRKKDTHDLCEFVSEKKLQRAQTNIAKRLDLQLAAYRLKLWNSNKYARDMRPVNFYILSNGQWTLESFEELRVTIEKTALLLSQFGLRDQIFISFIGFDNITIAVRSIEALASLDWGDGLKIRWNWWSGNVWGMLRGDLTDVDPDATETLNNNTNSNETSLIEKNFAREFTMGNDVASKGVGDGAELDRIPAVGKVEGLYELA